MNRCGNRGHLVFEFDDRSAAAALVLRRQLVMRDERMSLEERGNRAAKLPGAVAVNDTGSYADPSPSIHREISRGA